MPLKGVTIKLVQSVPEGEICELQPTLVLVKEEIKVREEAPKIPAKVCSSHTLAGILGASSLTLISSFTRTNVG